MSVYKPCDIRGPLTELSETLYGQWGYWLAAPLAPDSTVVVGGDVRPSSAAYRAAFIAGVRRHRRRVVDLGTVPTPMVYFVQRQRQAALAAIITASHSPPDLNGLKWSVHGRPPTEEEVRHLRRQVDACLSAASTDQAGQAAAAAGGPSAALSVCAAGGPEGMWPAACAMDASGTVTEAGPRTPVICEDPETAYGTWLRRHWHDPGARLHIILDPGGGCWAGRCAGLLRQVLPNCRVQVIHDEADGHFRARHPDSSRPRHLRALCESVRTRDADIGLAFDGDGDRVAVVDDQGVCLSAEQTTWLLLGSFGSAWAGRTFVHDIKLSRRLARAVIDRGGYARPQRSGHAFIRTTMQVEQALFGAEVSGHFFFADLDGGDDGLFAACRLLHHFASRGCALSALRAQCPAVYMAGDLRLAASPAEQAQIIAEVERQYADRPLDHIDGVRFEVAEGWGLVRPSVTAPELTFRFEGHSAVALNALVEDFAQRMGSVGEELLAQFLRE